MAVDDVCVVGKFFLRITHQNPAQDYLQPVDDERPEGILEEETDISCDADLHELCFCLMEERYLEAGHNADEAARLYRQLRPLTRAHLSESD